MQPNSGDQPFILEIEPDEAREFNEILQKHDFELSRKSGIYLSPVHLGVIHAAINNIKGWDRIRKTMQHELHGPYSGNKDATGHVIIKGMFPDGINPNNLTAEELAPFTDGRSYDFQTHLLTEQCNVMIAVAAMCGIPYRMFDAKTWVIPVAANPNVASDRFGGLDVNLLHEDGGFAAPRMRNSDKYTLGPGTEISMLVCINPDDQGYGVSWVMREDTEEIRDELTPNQIDMLESRIFFYSPSHGLNDAVPVDTAFPILFTDGKGIPRSRFSGKLIKHMERIWKESAQGLDAKVGDTSYWRKEVLENLSILYNLMDKRKFEYAMEAGDILISNQGHTMHGRNEVKDINRLLGQVFSRVPHAYGSTAALGYAKSFDHHGIHLPVYE